MSDILLELKKFKADFEAAQTLLTESQASVAKIQEQLTAKDAELVAKVAELTAKESELKGLADKVTAKDKELADITAQVASLKASQKSAEQIAVDSLATVGAKPMEVKSDALETDAVTTREQALEAYNAAQGAKAKAAVWKQYKALLK